MKKLIDFLFLIILGISVILPACFTSKESISKQENRSLEPYKSFYDTKKKFNLEWGKDLDAFISDRFWGRERLIQLNKLMVLYASIYTAKLGRATVDKKMGLFMNIYLEKNYHKKK